MIVEEEEVRHLMPMKYNMKMQYANFSKERVQQKS